MLWKGYSQRLSTPHLTCYNALQLRSLNLDQQREMLPSNHLGRHQERQLGPSLLCSYQPRLDSLKTLGLIITAPRRFVELIEPIYDYRKVLRLNIRQSEPRPHRQSRCDRSLRSMATLTASSP